MKRACIAVVALMAGLAMATARASSSRQVELAASGRFDQLQALLEAQAATGPLRTADRHALCFAYARTKRYDRLMPCLDELEAGVRKGDRRTRLLGLDDATPSIHVMRADALVELGQYEGAEDQARLCLEWLRKERSDDLDMQIQCLSARSLASTLGGDREAGRRHALELAGVRTGFLGGDYASVKALALARTWMALGEHERAVQAIQSDRGFALRNFLDGLVSGALLRGVNNWVWAELPRAFLVTKAYFESGRIDEARKGYDDLLKIPQVRANGEIHWQLLDDRARIAERDGQNALAIDLYRQSIAVIEQQRLSIATEANKIGFVGDKQAVYGRLVDSLLRAGRVEETFDVVERAKGRALVDLLARKEATSTPVFSTRRAGAAVTRLQSASRDAVAQVSLDMARAGAEPAAGTRTAASPLATLVGELQASDPELASLVSVSSVPVAEIQRRLLPGEVLVQYYVFGTRLYTLVVSAAAVDVRTASADGLEEQVRRFRASIESTTEPVQAQAAALHERLLGPVRDRLGDGGLLIVPHGPLHYLPFAALHDGQGWLVQRRPLRYLPSASVLRFLREPATAGLPQMLVLGNPDLGDARYDLPSAAVEAEAVARMSPGSRLFVGKAASEEAFKSHAASHRIVHVASHGEFNAAQALQSRLLLAPSGGHDGSLTVAELYELQLDADLVTLSACETGLGKVLSGDDVLGLTRGFLYAGSRNVVASQWQVDDAATAELMQRFYGHLRAGTPKREALRLAQVETSRGRPHPFFWAAFFLTGHGS